MQKIYNRAIFCKHILLQNESRCIEKRCQKMNKEKGFNKHKLLTIIGAAMCGPLMGAWLGLCFGVVVIATGGANLFFAFSIVGTLVTVLAKGIFCGFSAGLVHNLLNKWNKTVAVVAASVICPVVNTGIFLLGSALFFLPHANAIADMLAMDVTGFELFLALAMANFALELLMNILLSPVVVRLLDIWGKNKRRKKV